MIHWMLHSVNTFSQAVIKLARCVQTAAGMKSRMLGSLLPPTFKECVARATSLIWEHEMALTDTLISQGRLESLDIYIGDSIN